MFNLQLKPCESSKMVQILNPGDYVRCKFNHIAYYGGDYTTTEDCFVTDGYPSAFYPDCCVRRNLGGQPSSIYPDDAELVLSAPPVPDVRDVR